MIVKPQQVWPVELCGPRTFIYGALLQVRGEKEGGTRVACVGRTDALGFPAEKRRAAPRLRGVQGEAEQQSKGPPQKPAQTDRLETTQACTKTGSALDKQEVTLESILKRTATHLIIRADLNITTTHRMVKTLRAAATRATDDHDSVT